MTAVVGDEGEAASLLKAEPTPEAEWGAPTPFGWLLQYRNRRGSNPRRLSLLDFKSNPLTTRARLPFMVNHNNILWLIYRKKCGFLCIHRLMLGRRRSIASRFELQKP